MDCRICSTKLKYVFTHNVLGKYDVDYFVCGNCGLLQTEKPYWLQEAYSSAIADVDTGLIGRNLGLSRLMSTLLYFLFPRDKKYLDFGGGYGIFTRLMRDVGFDFYWEDPHCENLFSQGFEATNVKNGTFYGATAFEVLEHLEDPMDTIAGIMKSFKMQNLFFTTLLYHNKPPSFDWWYYSFGTGQHISFYNKSTLDWIAKNLGLHIYSYRNWFHLLTEEEIPEIYFKFILGMHEILYYYVCKKMVSRKMEDHKTLIKK